MKFIKENNHPLQEAVVQYRAPRAVKIGDVFYKIKAVDFQYFREPCLVCKDEKVLTINGVTFKCPVCGDSKETIRISGFVVQRYRVFKITDEVGSEDWKPDDHHRIVFGLYRKVGHGYQWADHSSCSFGEYALDRYFNISESSRLNTHNVDEYIFDDYQLAVKIANALTDSEVQRLEEYNTVHGSNYKPVFKTENDKKSN